MDRMIDIWQFILKLVMFCVAYYFTLDYIINCRVRTHIGTIIIIASVLLITFLYILFSK